jgi:hypothetical protein
MGNRGRIALALVLVLVPIAASAQQSAEPKAPFDSVFSKFAKSWAESTVPDPSAFARPNPLAELTSSRSFFTQRRFSIGAATRIDRPAFRMGQRQHGGSVARWDFDPVQASLFGNILDPSRAGETGPVDVRRQARAYLKQQIVQNILGRSAFGRGLGLFIDTGVPADHESLTNRSRLLPFLSPEFDAREQKAAMTLIWKF